MSRATRPAPDAAALAGDRDSEPTQKQHLDAEEGQQLGRAQHLVVCLGGGQLRLWLLRLLRLLGRSDWRGGRSERTERGAPGRGAALRHRPTRHGEKDQRDGDRGQRAACGTVSDAPRGAVSCQAAISSSSSCPHKDRLTHSEFIFMNPFVCGAPSGRGTA
jgi:hypothetical protein